MTRLSQADLDALFSATQDVIGALQNSLGELMHVASSLQEEPAAPQETP